MKQIKFFLLLAILLSSISAFSQNETSSDLFFSSIDSIIAKQLKFQKENRNTETVVFLKDSMVNYYYDDVVMPCENQPSKSYYTYDGFGNMTVLIVKNTPDEGCDAIKYKTLFTYENYNLIDRLYQNYDFDLNEWVNSSKRTYQYDANDNVIEELRLNWNPTTSTWDNNTKLTYLYDANLEIERKRFSWDSNINDWFWTLHETNSYDSNNNLLVYIYNSWDYGNSVWETINKKT